MVLTPFLTFQLSSGRHCLTFFVLVFWQTLRYKVFVQAKGIYITVTYT